MSNHFHILVEVPPKMDEGLSDGDLMERLKLIYSDDYVGMVRKQLRSLAESDTEKGMAAHAELREKFTNRMWDLGLFMKTLKQRFTRWYNAQNGRCGTLWESRYKSVLVESGHAARVMAAYIDLNPVRAGIVGRACTSSRSSAESPENYRWCSYAEAVAGGARGALARRGIARMMEERESQGDSDSAYDGWGGYVTPEHYAWRSIAGRYRVILFEDGAEVIKTDGLGVSKTVRKGFRAEDVERELVRGGKMSLSEVLRSKTSYFVDGGVIGGREFVKGVVKSLRGGYLSADRKSDGSKLPDHAGELWSMRKVG
jgi:REP element-mobilizing transposase RayT